MDKKISQLPAASSVTTDDLLAIVDDPGGTPVTQKATVSQLKVALEVTIQVYEGRDPAPPDDITKAAINFPVGGGTLTLWSPTAGAWV